MFLLFLKKTYKIQISLLNFRIIKKLYLNYVKIWGSKKTQQQQQKHAIFFESAKGFFNVCIKNT